MRALVFDFEGPLITPRDPFPRPVCMSSVTFDTQDTSAREPAILETADDGVDRLRSELERGSLMINAYLAFDVMVTWRHYPDTRPQWAHALENDRLTCVLRRQHLIDCAWDQFRKVYKLDSVAEALGLKVPDKKNPWRMKFGTLVGVPISEYPDAAVDYCLDDANTPVEIFLAQEKLRESPYFHGADCLKPQFFSTAKSVVLADMAGCGLHTDPESVACFRKYLEAQAEELRETLVENRLVVRNIHRDQAAIARRIFEWRPTITRTKAGKPSLAAAHYTGDVPDDVAAALAKGSSPLKAECDEILVEAGLATVVHNKSVKNTLQLMADVTDFVWYEDDDKKKEHPLPYDPENKATGKPSLTADACRKAKHPALLAYSRYQSVTKTLSTDIKLAEKAVEDPFCARYYPSKNAREITGEVGNVQNMPRMPGIRELWVAPDGTVYISADYPAEELRTFGQICYDVFGFSQVLDDLNAGKDLHSGVAADFLEIRIEDALALKEDDDPFFSNCRTMGKGLNFGAKGGMGPDRFVGYVWDSYGVDLSFGGTKDPREVAVRLLDIHDARTPEWRPYKYKYVNSFKRPGHNVFDVVLPYSGMLCAGLGWTEACNFPFSHLATIVAGTALINAFLARHGFSDMGEDDPLYGCMPQVFVHDEIVYAAEEARAPAAAQRLADIMAEAAAIVTPDADTPVKPCTHRQLSKLAKPVKGPDGELRPWCVFEAAAAAHAKDLEADAVGTENARLSRFPPWVALQFEGLAV